MIYIAGCNLVITTFPNHTYQNEVDENDFEEDLLNQEFIKIDEDLLNCSPEISSIAMSYDLRKLCIATIQKNARLSIWDICSKTKIGGISLFNVYIVSCIKFSIDSNILCCAVI